MTPPLHADPERRTTHTSTAPTLLDDADEPWGYECALPYLQAIGEAPEPGTDACPRRGWR